MNPIRLWWDRLAPLPGGTRMFGWLLGRLAPYTGTIRPRVLELRVGFARVRMADRRAVRNHLHSIHAIALMNLAEVTTGLALHYGMPDRARAILTHLSIEFVKKARGPLVAQAEAPVPNGYAPEDIEITTTVRDTSGDPVAVARAFWRVGPRAEPADG